LSTGDVRRVGLIRRGGINVCNETRHSRGANLRKMNLITHPLSGRLYPIVSVQIVGRVHSTWRRRQVPGLTPAKHTLIRPKLRYPTPAQCFDSRQVAQILRGYRAPDLLQQQDPITANLFRRGDDPFFTFWQSPTFKTPGLSQVPVAIHF
jgi:hypothetical protein